ncbi:hypothetical protein D8674_011586 [Pyrus ussuriensis x Pyrus communis]|uniref:Uncharacterized protein n=1 Tax=Pyrus ussuriensis x Pyrus communis TaxID=2448454 RepID=A0A5N5FZ60_9ROSA|nr:hypothetical protein D8674_011586 [Pyrus ussuriensis x Pyrus communis]
MRLHGLAAALRREPRLAAALRRGPGLTVALFIMGLGSALVPQLHLQIPGLGSSLAGLVCVPFACRLGLLQGQLQWLMSLLSWTWWCSAVARLLW